MLYIGADHRGFELKEKLKEWLKDHAHAVEDLGAYKLEPEDDYPDFAAAVARKVAECSQENKGDLSRACRGILLCGSGAGMAVVANKFKGIRASVARDVESVEQARAHGDENIVVLAADWTPPEQAREIVKTFLETPFSGEERHMRRLEKMRQIEESKP